MLIGHCGGDHPNIKVPIKESIRTSNGHGQRDNEPLPWAEMLGHGKSHFHPQPTEEFIDLAAETLNLFEVCCKSRPTLPIWLL